MVKDVKSVFNSIEKSAMLPIIFAGSGVSKRYTTNKFDWKELLIECISQYHHNPKNKYKEYETDIKYELDFKNINKFSINEGIGTKVERDFNKEYYKGNINNLEVYEDQNPLKVFIANKLSKYELDENMKEEIKLFQNLRDKMLTIITTNYDSFFEDHVFTKHDKTVGQEIFKKSELGTLFKIHGCVTKPNSIVLTSKDYEVFKRKRKVLSSKLINLFTENPVVFMGYSVTDENIRSILRDIFQCIDDDGDLKKFEERLILIDYNKNQAKPSVGVQSISIDEVEISITKIETPSFTPILEELQKLKRKVRFRDLKHIKELVYDIVQDDNAEKRKFVNLTNDDDDDVDDDEIIVIIAKESVVLDSVGITGIQSYELFDDLLKGSLDSKLKGREKLLVYNQLPNLFRGNTVLPIHKYIKDLKNDANYDPKVQKMIDMDVEDFITSSMNRDKESYKESGFESLKDIFESDIAISKKLNYLVIRSVYDSKPKEIIDFLLEFEDEINQNKNGTYFRKMACVYDKKKYKNA